MVHQRRCTLSHDVLALERPSIYVPGAVPDAVLHLVLVSHHSRENSWSGTNVVVHYIEISELSGHDKLTALGGYTSRLVQLAQHTHLQIQSSCMLHQASPL